MGIDFIVKSMLCLSNFNQNRNPPNKFQYNSKYGI